MTRIAMFASRNKDNTHLKNFKERRKLFFCQDANELLDEFENFVKQGQPQEVCRFYISVNARDEEKTKKMLACRLIMDDTITLENLKNITISIAMKPENAVEKKWLFDFDCNDKDLVSEFINNIKEYSDVPIEVFCSKNGFAVVVQHGFDTRALLKSWNDRLTSLNKDWGVELKRDAMLFYTWKVNE